MVTFEPLGAGRLPRSVREPIRPVEKHLPLPTRWADRAHTFRTDQPVLESAPIRLTTSSEPLLSIVIPVHGQWQTTETCLLSLQAAPPTTPIEVIVVDDASTDDTLDRLAACEGIAVVALPDNVGFVRATNAGIAAARGAFILLLNNDTIVLPGSLDHMVRRMLDHDDVGVVGARLVYPDGELQEAGGIVWSDADALNVGRGEPSDLARYGHPRDVDYCSGAALCVRAEILDELGGLDERFAPAYYEDTDLCFAARARGWRVVYEPKAVVVHLEGKSHGTDVEQGVKRFQERNRQRFAEKWRSELERQPQHCTELVLRAMQRTNAKAIVVVDHSVPTYDRDGGSMRMFQLLRILRDDGHDVIFLPSNGLLLEPYTSAIQNLGVMVIGDADNPENDLVEVLDALGDHVTAVVLSRRDVAAHFLPIVRAANPQVPIVFDTVDVHFLREQREAELLGDPEATAAALANREIEEGIMRDADLTLVVSDVEQDLVDREVEGARVGLLPNVHGAHPTPAPYSERSGLVFVGSYQHPPNVDAVLWFATDVLPLVNEVLPDLSFHVVGAGLPDHLRRLAGPNVVIEGWVPDLTEVYGRALVAVAPLRYGAGMKGKVVDALAHGVPVVGTSHGTEGMPDDVTCLVDVADDPEGLAAAIVALVADEARWTERHLAGPAVVDAHYGISAVAAQLRGILHLVRSLAAEYPNPAASALAQPLAEQVAYADRRAKEIDTFKGMAQVHDLPEMYHYWSNRYLRPILESFGYSHPVHFFEKELATQYDQCERSCDRPMRVASIGSGNCDAETLIASGLVASGRPHVVIECIDINAEMLKRGTQMATEQGLERQIQALQADFNSWEPDCHYDTVMANQALHHVVELEHLFDSIHRAIGESGSFLVSDMIGRNGHARWPEALTIVEEYWAEMPEQKRFSVPLQRQENEFVNWDCSTEGFEGIRAQDILPLLIERFGFRVFVAFANVVDPFIDRGFGGNFDVDSEEDKAFIDRIHERDEAEILAGNIKPTHMLAVMVGDRSCEPQVWKHLSPEFCVRRVD